MHGGCGVLQERPLISSAAQHLPVLLGRLPSNIGSADNKLPSLPTLAGPFGNVSFSASPQSQLSIDAKRQLGLLAFKSDTPWRLKDIRKTTVDGSRGGTQTNAGRRMSRFAHGTKLVSEVEGLLLLDGDLSVEPPLEASELGIGKEIRCPDQDQFCIHLVFNITLPERSEIGDFGIIGRNVGNLECWLWSLLDWKKSFCLLSDVVLNGEAHGQARCSCDRGGIVVVAFVPNLELLSPSDAVRTRLRMARLHHRQVLVLTIPIAVALAVAGVFACLHFRKKSGVDSWGGDPSKALQSLPWTKLATEDLTVAASKPDSACACEAAALPRKQPTAPGQSQDRRMQHLMRTRMHSGILLFGDSDGEHDARRHGNADAMLLADGYWHWFEDPVLGPGWNKIYFPRLKHDGSPYHHPCCIFPHHSWFAKNFRWICGLREHETFGEPVFNRLPAYFDHHGHKSGSVQHENSQGQQMPKVSEDKMASQQSSANTSASGLLMFTNVHSGIAEHAAPFYISDDVRNPPQALSEALPPSCSRTDVPAPGMLGVSDTQHPTELSARYLQHHLVHRQHLAKEELLAPVIHSIDAKSHKASPYHTVYPSNAQVSHQLPGFPSSPRLNETFHDSSLAQQAGKEEVRMAQCQMTVRLAKIAPPTSTKTWPDTQMANEGMDQYDQAAFERRYWI